MAVRLLAAGVSLAVTLLAAETVLTVWNPQLFDVHPRGMYVEDQAVGYVLTPGFDGLIERAEFRHQVGTNTKGFRGAEVSIRGAGTYRIVCLGDSFTWGFGVAPAQTFAHRLEGLLRHQADVQVINAGVPGYGTADALNLLESRSGFLNPDLVILQFLADNDFVENRRPAKGNVAVEDGWLVSGHVSADSDASWHDWLRRMKRKSHLASFVSERTGYLAMITGLLPAQALSSGADFSDDDSRLAVELIHRVTNAARSHGARTIVLFTTGQQPVVGSAPEWSARDTIAEAARLAGAEFIDLMSHMRGHARRMELYYPVDGHWTPQGHEVVAQALATHLGRLERSDP